MVLRNRVFTQPAWTQPHSNICHENVDMHWDMRFTSSFASLYDKTLAYFIILRFLFSVVSIHFSKAEFQNWESTQVIVLALTILLTGFQVIAAEGEMTASRSLKDAADIMGEAPAAMQLRYLQTLNTISAEKNSTIIFPMPVDFMNKFFQK